jgi:hypothetical protein
VPQPKPITLVFEKAPRETKNKLIFEEAKVGPDGNPVKERPGEDKPVVGMLYVHRKVIKGLGEPDILHVTIQAP